MVTFNMVPTSPSEDLTYLIKPPPGNNTVLGSVNGLICFANDVFDPDSLHIWNPSLSAIIALPPCTAHTDREYAFAFRFGFDPITCDYKVVKITYSFDSLDDMIEELLPVEVYSMRKNSWESITERFPSHITCFRNHDEVYVDGYDVHVHWLCYIDMDCRLLTIMAFDLNLETFSEILLPDSIQSNRRNNLGVLSRKLCVISCIYNGDFEVWVMDKYKVASSWMKLHVLSGFTGNIDPIGFTLNGKFIFESDLRLALYDPKAAASKLFKGMKPFDYSITRVAQYIDSLVWPVARNVSHPL